MQRGTRLERGSFYRQNTTSRRFGITNTYRVRVCVLVEYWPLNWRLIGVSSLALEVVRMPTNVEIVHAVDAAFVRGDIPALLDLCDENGEMFVPGDRSILPYAGAWKGRNGIAEFFRTLDELIEVTRWTLQDTLASGDRVVTIGTWDYRGKRTGRTVTNAHWAIDFTVRNGKVVRHEVYVDTAPAEKALSAAASA